MSRPLIKRNKIKRKGCALASEKLPISARAGACHIRGQSLQWLWINRLLDNVDMNKHCPCLAVGGGWHFSCRSWPPIVTSSLYPWHSALAKMWASFYWMRKKARLAAPPHSSAFSLFMFRGFQLMGVAASIPALNGFRGSFLQWGVWECVGQKSPSCWNERGGGGVAAAALSFTEAGIASYSPRRDAGVFFLLDERTADSSSKKTAMGWRNQIIGGGIGKDLTRSLTPAKECLNAATCLV